MTTTVTGSTRIAIAISVIGFVVLALSAAARVRPENKWRIQCSEGAKSDGAIVFRIWPEAGDPIDVSVSVEKGTRENNVARRIRDVLRESLPKDQFKVELDDNEDVLLKNRWLTGKFGLEVVSNDVKAVRINLDRE